MVTAPDTRTPFARGLRTARALYRDTDPFLRRLTWYWAVLTPVCLVAAGTPWLHAQPVWWQILLSHVVVFSTGLAWGVLVCALAMNAVTDR